MAAKPSRRQATGASATKYRRPGLTATPFWRAALVTVVSSAPAGSWTHRCNPPLGSCVIVESGSSRVTSAGHAAFDMGAVSVYSYRHTYVQRHADAGVPVNVLRELLDHLRMDTTQRQRASAKAAAETPSNTSR